MTISVEHEREGDQRPFRADHRLERRMSLGAPPVTGALRLVENPVDRLARTLKERRLFARYRQVARHGIVTERDVLRIVGEGQDPKSVSVRDAMTADPVTIVRDASIKEAAEIMFQKWFRHLPVTGEDGKVVGVISLRDLLTLVAESLDDPAHLQTLTGHKLVRDKRLERVEAGDLD